MSDSATSRDHFPFFLDAMKDAASRSRTVLFVNILLLMLSISQMRDNFWPDWLGNLVEQSRQMTICLDKVDNTAWKSGEKEGCQKEIETYFSGNVDDLDKKNHATRRAFFEHRLFNMADNEDKNAMFQIPFFNILLHVNDSWIVSGMIMSVTMWILAQYTMREYQIVLLASSSIKNKSEFDIVISNHAFAGSSQGKILLFGAYFIPVILNLVNTFADLSRTSIKIEFAYLGIGGYFEYAGEIIFSIVLLGAALQCFYFSDKIGKLLDSIKSQL